MAIPACLWRRTGEIYKANREFAELVGVDGYMLRDVCDLPSGRVTPSPWPNAHMTLCSIVGEVMYLRTHG